MVTSEDVWNERVGFFRKVDRLALWTSNFLIAVGFLSGGVSVQFALPMIFLGNPFELSWAVPGACAVVSAIFLWMAYQVSAFRQEHKQRF